MTGCSISGGGGRFGLFLQSLIEMRKNGASYDVACGVSSGYLALLCDIMGIADEVMERLLKGEIKWLLHSPLTPSGKLSWYAIYCRILGRNYLGWQQEDVYIKKWITPEMWEQYRSDNSKPTLYGLAVCIETEEPVFFNCKQLDYEQMVQWSCATCRVPLWVQSQKIGNLHYCDGGAADHNASQYLVKAKKIKKLYSIWSTPYIDVFYPKGFYKMFGKIASMQSSNNTADDWETEQLVCDTNGIDLRRVRLKDVLKTPYDTDAGRLQASINGVLSQLEKNIF